MRLLNSVLDWFPNQTQTSIENNVLIFWKFVGGFPFPRYYARCPVCGKPDFYPRQWRFFEPSEPGGRRVRGRCDVSFKCHVCSFVGDFGIPIPSDVTVPVSNSRVYHWREVMEILDHEQ